MTENTSAAPIELLLVDDDADLRNDVASFLATRGYRVQCCADGEEAVEQADRRAFNVAILDLSMPGMSGIEVLQKLKARDAECEVVMLCLLYTSPSPRD